MQRLLLVLTILSLQSCYLAKIKSEHAVIIPAITHEEVMEQFLGKNRLELIREYGVPDKTFEVDSSVFYSWILDEEIISSFSSSSYGNPIFNSLYHTNHRYSSGKSKTKVVEQIIELEFVNDVCVRTKSENIDFSIAEHIEYDEEYYSDEVQSKISVRKFAGVVTGGSTFLFIIYKFSGTE